MSLKISQGWKWPYNKSMPYFVKMASLLSMEELNIELIKRSLDINGAKSELIERLQQAMDNDEEDPVCLRI